MHPFRRNWACSDLPKCCKKPKCIARSCTMLRIPSDFLSWLLDFIGLSVRLAKSLQALVKILRADRTDKFKRPKTEDARETPLVLKVTVFQVFKYLKSIYT